MKHELTEEVRLALYHLLQVASKNKVIVTGFTFTGDPPAITSFGNCTDHADIKLYQGLCDMYEEKKRAGLVLIEDVQKPV